MVTGAGSGAEIEGLRLSQLDVGVALYVKKPTFGPGEATLRDVQVRDVSTRILKDDQSRLVR